MVNDPAQVLELANRLDDLTVTIAKAARVEDLRETVRATWKLARRSSPRSGRPPHARRARRVARGRSSRRSGRSPATASSARARCPQRGVEPHAVDPREGEPERARLVPRDRVIPERMAKPDGAVFQEFSRRSPRRGSARSSSG